MPLSVPIEPPSLRSSPDAPSRTHAAWLSRGLDFAFHASTWLVLAYAAHRAVLAWSEGFDLALLDRHSFRQTQTAISVFSMAHGGPLLDYEMPVLGAPYSIPFEFPLYQWVVLFVHKSGVALNQAGRAVSIGFFVLTLVPLYRILRRCEVPSGSARLTVAVLLSAPMYLYWTRTFLIESTALFFSVAALSAGLDWLEKREGRGRLVWLVVSASAAMLVKPTTGFTYLSALGFIFATRFLIDPDRRRHVRTSAAFVVAAFLVPIALLALWTRHADAVKAQNLLANGFITSSALHQWTYGTIQMKLDPVTWRVLWERTNDETFGATAGFLICATLAFGASRWPRGLAFFASVVGTYAVFTNLHAVHDYYQYATGAMVVLIVGLGLGALETSKPRARLLTSALAFAIVLTSIRAYDAGYAVAQRSDDRDWVRVGEFVRAHTSRRALMVGFGEEWSPLVPYYAERHALMIRSELTEADPNVQRTLERSMRLGSPVEAVIFCGAQKGVGYDRAIALLNRAPRYEQFSHCAVAY